MKETNCCWYKALKKSCLFLILIIHFHLNIFFPNLHFLICSLIFLFSFTQEADKLAVVRGIPSLPNHQIFLQRNPNFLSKEILIFPQSDPNCRNFQQRLPICSRQQPSLHVRRKLQEMLDGNKWEGIGKYKWM